MNIELEKMLKEAVVTSLKIQSQNLPGVTEIVSEDGF
jgi:hypothetical protein